MEPFLALALGMHVSIRNQVVKELAVILNGRNIPMYTQRFLESAINFLPYKAFNLGWEETQSSLDICGEDDWVIIFECN